MVYSKTAKKIDRLAYDGIDKVFIVPTLSGQFPRSEYSERPTRYMVTLSGENRKRRVYATPIGNVSVLYLKIGGKLVYCETALDAALHRPGKDY